MFTAVFAAAGIMIGQSKSSESVLSQDRAVNLFNFLISGQTDKIIHPLTLNDVEAMRTVNDLHYDFKAISFRPIRRLAINYLMSAARLALQAIGAAA